MNMTPNPWDITTELRRENTSRTQGYGPRPSQGMTVIPEQGFADTAVQEEAQPPKESEKPILESYLEKQFDRIKSEVHFYLSTQEEKQSLEQALAEVEFYKKLVADAKVAWTQTVPHEEFNWDGLINLGTILSRTPDKA